MTQKAFLFDVDGVLVDTELMWESQKQLLYTRILGENITRRLGQTRGVSMEGIYDMACALGATVSRQDFIAEHLRVAPAIYDRAPIVADIDMLGNILVSQEYALGVVSSSPNDWVKRVVERLPFRNDLKLVVTLHDMGHIPQKPAPDGYLYAMKELGSIPETTIILEDSNSGIMAATASGAFTIAFSGLLNDDYKQLRGDAMARTIDEVIRIVARRG